LHNKTREPPLEFLEKEKEFKIAGSMAPRWGEPPGGYEISPVPTQLGGLGASGFELESQV